MASSDTSINTSENLATNIGNIIGNLIGSKINSSNFKTTLNAPTLKTQFTPQQEYIQNNQKWINDWKKKQQQIQFDYSLIEPEREAANWNDVKSVQNWLNTHFNSGLDTDNFYGRNTDNVINTVLKDSTLTDEERAGLQALQNSWQNRMVGQRKKSPTLLQKPETSNDQERFKQYMYTPGNLQVTYSTPVSQYVGKYQSGGFVPTSGYGFEQAIKDSQNNSSPNRDYFLYEGEKWTGPNGYTDVKQRGLLKGTWNFLGRYWDFLINGGHPGLYYRNFTDTNIKKSKIKPETDKPKKFQQGGNMANKEQEIQQAFMAFLIEDAAAQGLQIKTEEDLKAYAQQLGEEGLQAKYQEFMQKMQGGVKAKLGAKLNYMRKIKGLCPDGEEAYYFKEGGQVKRGCKCMEKGGVQPNSLDENPNKNAIEKFKERKKKNLQKPSKKSKYEQMHEEFKKRQPSQDSPLLGPGKEATEYAKKVLSNKCGNKVKKASEGETLGLKGKINKYNDPDPKNPQKVLYDNYGNSVINEKGYFIKRKDLPNNKFKDDTIKSNDPRYNKIKLEFNNQK